MASTPPPPLSAGNEETRRRNSPTAQTTKHATAAPAWTSICVGGFSEFTAAAPRRVETPSHRLSFGFLFLTRQLSAPAAAAGVKREFTGRCGPTACPDTHLRHTPTRLVIGSKAESSVINTKFVPECFLVIYPGLRLITEESSRPFRDVAAEEVLKMHTGVLLDRK